MYDGGDFFGEEITAGLGEGRLNNDTAGGGALQNFPSQNNAAASTMQAFVRRPCYVPLFSVGIPV